MFLVPGNMLEVSLSLLLREKRFLHLNAKAENTIYQEVYLLKKKKESQVFNEKGETPNPKIFDKRSSVVI